jgi:D-3-phosphoglycerate dehydrogenase / 2-oxoglutarate reductase
VVQSILILGRIHEVGLDILRARPGVSFEIMAQPAEPDILALAPTADAIIVRTTKLTAAAIDAAPKLKIVSRHGVGYDNVDMAALDRRRIPLTLVGNVNALPVAEHTLFMMLSLAKRGIAYDRATRNGDWKLRDSFGATELAGKTLLLLGFGRIGHEVARRARAFGMTVLAYDPYVRDAAMFAARVQPVAKLAEAIAQADFISVHLPMTAETKGIIGAQQFAAMKKTAIVISTARGGLVDEAALADALKSGQIRAAGLDVFVDEPPAPNDPLLRLDNLLLSPHIAGLTEECAMRMAEVSARNALAGLDGRVDPELVVNKHVLNHR